VLAVPNPGRTVANVQPPPAAAEPGNLRRLTHGARSDRLVEPRAADLAGQVLDAHPHLDARRDGPAVLRYARLLARIERVEAWLEAQPDPDFRDPAEGEVHAVLARLDKWTGSAALAEARLGLDPMARARLGLAEAQRQALDPSTAIAAAAREDDPVVRRALLARAGVIDLEPEDGGAGRG
jgi:hypothetical protein